MKKSTAFAAGVLTGLIIVITSTLVSGQVPALEGAPRLPLQQVMERRTMDSGREEAGKFGQDSPMGRPGQPEEIAPAYVFLASEADSSYITGIILEVMGETT